MTNDTLDQWFPQLLKVPAAAMNDPIYEYALPVDRAQLSTLYKDLEDLHAQKSTKKGAEGKSEKGALAAAAGAQYEKLLRHLFGGGGALSVVTNVRTTTNEIDLLLKIEPIASLIPLFRNLGTHIIGEAKCHTKAPSSELANETRGILDTHSAKCAYIFVFCTKRTLAAPARNSIALSGVQGFYIVPVGRKQIEEVIAGAPLCRLLSDQHMLAAVHGTKLSI